MDWDTLKTACDSLHRYAGWLDRERASVAVRADVHALETAIDARTELAALVEQLDADLARLPGGSLRNLMRAASKKLRSAAQS